MKNIIIKVDCADGLLYYGIGNFQDVSELCIMEAAVLKFAFYVFTMRIYVLQQILAACDSCILPV